MELTCVLIKKFNIICSTFGELVVFMHLCIDGFYDRGIIYRYTGVTTGECIFYTSQQLLGGIVYYTDFNFR